MSWIEIVTSEPLYQIFSLRRPGVANSAGIIIIAIMLIETTFYRLNKNKKKCKKKRIKMRFLFVFPDITKTAKV